MAGESGTVMLHELIAAHREEIIRRCRAKVAARPVPRPAEAEINHGVALFLDQLVRALRPGQSSSPEIGTNAGLHGHDLLLQGFTVGQVVHDYGDVRQSITDLAVDMDAPITPDDYRTLNRCFDDAVAAAVTEHGAERHPLAEDEEPAGGSERIGFLAHELGNLTQTAMLAFEVLKTGSVGAGGNTGAVLYRSLIGIRGLVACSLAEVRLTHHLENRERFLVSGFIDEIAPAAALEANAKGIRFTVMPVEDSVTIHADRQVLGAVVGNLLQNAFKFTRPRTTVTLRVGASTERVLIEVQDECGGLPDGNINELFRPFEQRSADRSGLGLGLAFSRRGVEANDGLIYARNLPHHQGCVFTLDLPRLAPRLIAR
jgi:signal transduction histidine kinase